MNGLTEQVTQNTAEAHPLATELANARRKLVELDEERYGLSPREALAKVQELDTPQQAAYTLSRPPGDMSWWDLDFLTAVDPEAGTQRWQEVIDVQRDNLESGHRAAIAVEAGDSECQKRAEFLAMREQLAEEWQPRTGIETTLIDMMAQAVSMQYIWTKRLMEYDEIAINNRVRGRPQDRDCVARAIDQAAAMVDRFNRMFMRALRQLRDLRRYVPTVVVQNAGQVNIAEQQVNVGAGNDGNA